MPLESCVEDDNLLAASYHAMPKMTKQSTVKKAANQTKNPFLRLSIFSTALQEATNFNSRCEFTNANAAFP